MNELSALSMLASSELYELERKEREREREREHSQYEPDHHQQQSTYSSSGATMTPPVPPSCHHEECQRSYRTALRVYQQAQQSQANHQGYSNSRPNYSMPIAAANGAHLTPSPHDEYVSFPGMVPSNSNSHNLGYAQGAMQRHPSSPASTDSSDISRSPPMMHIRHGHQQQQQQQQHYQYNPYARPTGNSGTRGNGKFSHPGTPRFYTPATSPVLAPVRSTSSHHLPAALPVPTMVSESAVRGGAKDFEDDEDLGEMDVDMRMYSLSLIKTRLAHQTQRPFVFV